MDNNLTDKLKTWLDTPDADRDYEQGALLLLRLSGNRVMYAQITANLTRFRLHIEHQLRKYLDFRLQALTHEQVIEMSAKVDDIAKEHALDQKQPKEKHRTGKRPDHDALPDDIKARFVENLSLLRKMRELHLRLRSLSLEGATCPDSERYPFLKELISLDKKLHQNWEIYDKYVCPPHQLTENQHETDGGHIIHPEASRSGA